MIRRNAIRVTPWRPAWSPDRRRTFGAHRYPKWLRSLRGLAGVYLFRERGSVDVIYVGKALNLHKTITRHFHAWGPNRNRLAHRRVCFERALIEVRVYVLPPELIRAAEARLIARHRPSENARAETTSRVPF